MKEANFKDSEREAPEAVQSTAYRPQKKVRARATLHTHGMVHQAEVESTRSNDLLERIRRKIAEKKADPCNGDNHDGSSDNRRKETEIGKGKAEAIARQSANKKAKFGKQGQLEPKPQSMSRKRLREELEEKIDESRSHQARAREEESKQAKKKQREVEQEDAEGPEAIFEVEPQLPCKQGGTQAILDRLKRRSEEIVVANSAKVYKKGQMHERDAIARLLNGGWVFVAT